MPNLSTILDSWLFRPGGRYNIALARIAIAIALWLTLHGSTDFGLIPAHYNDWLAARTGAGWNPKGIIKVTDFIVAGPPPEWLVVICYHSANVAIIAMALGFLVPYSQIMAALAATFMVSLETSFGPYWSHAYNVQLLAALAFMFGRSADVWSVDALIRRYRLRPPPQRGNVYWWPVIFAELATAMFMFGAFIQKVRETGIHWAWSDNLRNSLIISWFQYRSDPPPLALWIADHAWVWKLAGTLQLFAQSTTILAAFLVGWPLFRLLFGGVFFFVEILALAHVFRFWHPFWIPLCFLSVDFEYFWRRFVRRERPQPEPSLWPSAVRLGAMLTRAIRSASVALAQAITRALQMALRWLHRCVRSGGAALAWMYRKLLQTPRALSDFFVLRSEHRRAIPILAFGLAFFGYYAANLAWKLGEKHLNYPFSSMAFYSETRALKPYRQHKYWPVYTGRADIYQAGSDEPMQLWYRDSGLEDMLFRVNTLADLEAIDKSFVARAKAGLALSKPRVASTDPGYVFQPVAAAHIVYRAGLMAAPPYPAKPGLVDLHMGYRAVRDEHGFRALVATARWDEARQQIAIEMQHEGFDHPRFEMLARFNVREDPRMTEPEPLEGTWEGDTFYVRNNPDGRYIYSLIRVTDESRGLSEIYYGPDNFQSYR